MLRIVYPICYGIDVHKKFIVACIASTNDNGVTNYKSSCLSTFTKGLRELSEWLSSNSCKDICMESTGKYWIPVFNILEATCKIALAHPKYVKAIRGKKTDKKDAKWIANLFKHDLQLTIDGMITPEQALKLTIIRQHYDNLELCKLNLEQVILSLTEPFQKELNLVATVPGIKAFSANVAERFRLISY